MPCGKKRTSSQDGWELSMAAKTGCEKRCACQRTNKTAEYLGEKKTAKTEEGIAPQGCEYFGEKTHRVLLREDSRRTSTTEKRGAPLVSRGEDTLTLATSRDTEHICVTPESRGSAYRAPESDVGRERRVYSECKRTSTTEKGEGAATAASHISRFQLQKEARRRRVR
jgi:hypothetical protein